MKEHDPLHFLKFKRGEELSQSKLTEDKVIEARRLYAQSRSAIADLNENYSINGLANRYRVHPRTMEKALKGETWGHVK